MNKQESFKITRICCKYTILFFKNIIKHIFVYTLNIVFEQFKYTKDMFDVNSCTRTLTQTLGIVNI